jgi:hypothetical protein
MLEPLPFEITGKAAHGGFDFGKLGHGLRPLDVSRDSVIAKLEAGP